MLCTGTWVGLSYLRGTVIPGGAPFFQKALLVHHPTLQLSIHFCETHFHLHALYC